MQYKIETKNNETIIIQESVWTGSRNVFVNSQKAEKLNKTNFIHDGKNYQLNGNTFSGLVLLADGERYTVSKPIAWYEIVLAALAFVFDMIWGNIPASVSTFPIVAGAIGGAICAAAAVINIMAMTSTKKAVLKVLVGFLISFLAIIICHLIALVLLGLLK